jgi:uncharacterized protein
VAGHLDHIVPIKIAGGQADGVYLQFAKLLATEINAAERGLSSTAVETDGSVENLRMIDKGDAHIGIAMADATVAAIKGQDPFVSALPIMAIGRVYQNYLQLVVRESAQLHEVTDLRGKIVSLGPEGSGTAMFGRRLFDAIKLDVNKQHPSLQDATADLEKGLIDALLWMGGVPTRALAELDRRIGIRLLPIWELPPNLRDLYGDVYLRETIPPGSYGAETPTIGVANLLVCASTLADRIAAAVARVLIERAANLVPSEALGTQFLDNCSLIGTFGVPKHPGAAAAYRREHG